MKKPQLTDWRHKRAAWKELRTRYREHFMHFWKRRHEITLPDLKPHESEFLPSALSLQTKPMSPGGRWLARIIIALILVLFTWSVFGRMDIIVNASGKIIPSERTKVIASVETARVERLHVKEGQVVRAGDLLVELDTRMTEHDQEKANVDRYSALLQIARSRAMLASIDQGRLVAMRGVDSSISASRVADSAAQLKSQWNDFIAKRQRLDGEIERYKAQLVLATQRVKDYKELSKNRDVAVHAWLEKEQERTDLEGRLNEAINQRRALISETQKTTQDALNDALRVAASSEQDAERAVARKDTLQLRAPVDGTIQQLTVHTIGGVVPSAQQLMVIVPSQDQIKLEAFVENKDIGFIHEGQRAAVKVETFNYTKYGMIDGHVSHVSRDAIDPSGMSAVDGLQKGKQKGDQEQQASKGPVYSVHVLLDKKSMNIDGRTVDLMPGMTASIEIKIGTRRIIEYFLSPLIRNTHESMNER